MSDRKPPAPDTDLVICARCARQLQAGTGDFWEVKIDAVADPSPPRIADDLQAEALREQLDRLIQQLGDLSAQEAMDQVCRRLVLHLCNPCYRQWIENPTP